LTVDEPQTTDAELIRRTLAGERNAYGVLMLRYQRPLHALVRGIVRVQEDADDLVQETFFRAYRFLDRFDTERALRPWLFKIGANLCFRHLRRSRRGSWVSLEDEHPQTGRRLVERLENPGAEEAVTRPLETARLAEAIDRLPPLHRTILLLRGVHGLHYDEIAETLAVPAGTVMSRLNRGRRALRQLLAEPTRAGAERKRTR
jgi:RNA polymerase sigma-70 factor (ECF subfamily)